MNRNASNKMPWVMLLPIIFLSCFCLNFDSDVEEFAPEYPGISPWMIPLEDSDETSSEAKISGGTLVISTRVQNSKGENGIQNPSFSSWGPGIVYSRLFRLRSGEGVELPNQIVECDLCDSWTLRDPTTLEIHLKTDVFWQKTPPVNGRAVTIEDVVLSLEQLAKSDSHLLAGGFNIREIETTPSGILIHMLTPDPDILISLANGSSKIIPLEHLGIEDLHPDDFVGSGPWEIQSTDSNDRFEFKANKDYFEIGYPHLDGLKILVIKDGATRLAAFKNGILDIGQLATPESIDYLEFHREIRDSMYIDYGSGVNLLLNTQAYPFLNPQIRQALFFSIDPWTLNQDFMVNASVVSSGIPIIDSSWILENEIWEAGLNNSARALELLSLENEGSLLPLDLLVADYGDSHLEYAERFVNQAKPLGFEFFITPLNPTDYLEKVWLKKEFTIALGPTPPMKTPNQYLKNIVHSQGSMNISGYQHKELDYLIQRQSEEWDLSKRTNLIKSVKLHMLENAVGLMLSTNTHVWAWWPKVQDLHLNFANSEYIFWSRVWLENRPK